MIKLKNVSKFYYSKGVIASGLSKVNLSLDRGEFVAITGESGSGKSTLLNIIGGLDSYEEGEMYINGEETSHYTEKDFEDYRRKYIGNIFQNFNLVNSYTVYQNIELVLLLNGKNKKEVKNHVIDLIKKVDLYRFKNTKVSKLSGGQKQRVAIARALAKDTPILLADEPTGNLDSKSAQGIIRLLSEIAKDKLVIVVTHNYEQVEPYVTRKIKMHDGKVLEDKKIREKKKIEEENLFVSYQNITTRNKLRLGIRNTFNILPKFLLIFAVYLFMTVSLISQYASFKQEEYLLKTSGYNYYFSESSDKRIVIKKEDASPFHEEDYQNIHKIQNIDYVVKDDLLLDSYFNISDDENIWLGGNVADLELLTEATLDVGKMPENDNEIIICGRKEDTYLQVIEKELLSKDFYFQNIYTGELNKNKKLKIVGIMYEDTENYYNFGMKFYVSKKLLSDIEFQIHEQYSNIQILFLDTYYSSNYYDAYFKLIPNDKVPSGKAYISNDLTYSCPNYQCLDQPITVEVNNLYYQDNLTLRVEKTYTKNNIKNLLGRDDYDNINGAIFLNIEDYNRLFNKESYQSSVFVSNVQKIEETVSSLRDMGYKTLSIKDTFVSDGASEIMEIVKTVVTILLVITLFFISYFVIRLILKSRNVYFSIIRMLGATKKIAKELLIIELLLVSNLAYFGFLLFLLINHMGWIHVSFVSVILNYLKPNDYILLYVILILISYLISQKFAKKLFKNSVVQTIKEEV